MLLFAYLSKRAPFQNIISQPPPRQFTTIVPSTVFRALINPILGKVPCTINSSLFAIVHNSTFTRVAQQKDD